MNTQARQTEVIIKLEPPRTSQLSVPGKKIKIHDLSAETSTESPVKVESLLQDVKSNLNVSWRGQGIWRLSVSAEKKEKKILKPKL